jgi:hypothetical protein
VDGAEIRHRGDHIEAVRERVKTLQPTGVERAVSGAHVMLAEVLVEPRHGVARDDGDVAGVECLTGDGHGGGKERGNHRRTR